MDIYGVHWLVNIREDLFGTSRVSSGIFANPIKINGQQTIYSTGFCHIANLCDENSMINLSFSSNTFGYHCHTHNEVLEIVFNSMSLQIKTLIYRGKKFYCGGGYVFTENFKPILMVGYMKQNDTAITPSDRVHYVIVFDPIIFNTENRIFYNIFIKSFLQKNSQNSALNNEEDNVNNLHTYNTVMYLYHDLQESILAIPNIKNTKYSRDNIQNDLIENINLLDFLFI